MKHLSKTLLFFLIIGVLVSCGREEVESSEKRNFVQRDVIGDWSLQISDNNTSIDGYNGFNKTLVIPQFVEDKEIKGVSEYVIGSGFKVERGKSIVTKLDFSSNSNLTAHSIGVFANFTKVKEIVFNDNLVLIDRFAFPDCISLDSLRFPHGLQNIGDNAFNNCSNLVYVELNPNLLNIEEHVFSDCKNISNVILTRATAPLTKCDSSSFEMGVIDSIFYPKGMNYPELPGWDNYDVVWEEY